MKIVVLDGYTLNPGDLSWERLGMLGELVVYERTASSKILERTKGAEIILTNKTQLKAEILNQLTSVRYIGVLATGYNVVDIHEAGKLGVVVTNIPAYSTSSVAQLTFALILELCHHVQKFSDSVMEGKWSCSVDFTYRDYPLMELESKTIGIIGFGNIGQKVCNIASAFGMNVIAFDNHEGRTPACNGSRQVSLEDLMKESDIVTVHLPLTPETTGMINKQTLSLMKKTAFFINTSRGAVVVDQDLADALNNDLIAGAGLDVLSVEPPPRNNPLLNAKNVVITPHIAWSTREARERLMNSAVTNVEAYLGGNPVNVVNLV
ncbi:MAG TPA: D-2-hydroxyacid dehydrogenase [Bacteroidales bacterium]|nr:D-2-hydroxyacid dehydrogenase [Bacteroidales bacterium]